MSRHNHKKRGGSHKKMEQAVDSAVNMLQPQLDSLHGNNQKQYGTSFYKSLLLTPQTASLTLQTTQTSMSTFEIPPANVYNYYHSRLSFLANVPTVATSFVYTDATCFSWIQKTEFYTAEGSLQLINLQDSDKYSKLAGWVHICPEGRTQADGYIYPSGRSQLSSNGDAAPATTYVSTTGGGVNGLYMGVNDFAIFNNPSAPRTAGPAAANTPLVSSEVVGSFKTPALHDFGGVILVAPALGTDFNINARLGDICPSGSLFAIDRDLYSQKTYIRFTFNSTQRIFTSVNAVNNSLHPTYTPYTANTIPLQNFTLIMALQANQDIVALERARASQQMALVVPDILPSSQTVIAASTQQTTMKINSSVAESRLLESIFGIFYPDNQFIDTDGAGTSVAGRTSNLYADSNNLSTLALPVTGSIATMHLWPNVGSGPTQKIDQFFQYMNGNLVLGPLFCSQNQDYGWIKNICKKHGFSSLEMQKLISPYINYFDSDYNSRGYFDGQTLRGMEFLPGNEISLQHTFTVGSNAGVVQLTHYLFSVILKKIYMRDGLFSFSPFY